MCEAHGGRVRDLIGDAVMAAFGIPVVHEDDALRAVRAAAEMRRAAGDAERRAGAGIRPPTAIAHGDQHGRGRRTRSRSDRGAGPRRCGQRRRPAGGGRGAGRGAPGRGHVSARRGRRQRGADRAARAQGQGGARRRVPPAGGAAAMPRRSTGTSRCRSSGGSSSSPSSGRPSQRAARERRCHLVTVFGQAGIGKSRLSQEFAVSVEARRACSPAVVSPTARESRTGRCARSSAQAAGDRSVRALLDGSADADVRRGATRERDRVPARAGPSRKRSSGRVRKLVEVLARERPSAARVRGHPLGGADAARPDRVPRRLGAGCSGAHRLPRPAGAARRAAQLGRRQAQRGLGAARSALCRGVVAADRSPSGRRRRWRRRRGHASPPPRRGIRSSSSRCSRCSPQGEDGAG